VEVNSVFSHSESGFQLGGPGDLAGRGCGKFALVSTLGQGGGGTPKVPDFTRYIIFTAGPVVVAVSASFALWPPFFGFKMLPGSGRSRSVLPCGF